MLDRDIEEARFSRDAFLGLALTLLGSGVFAVILAVAVTNTDPTGIGLRPVATALAFVTFLLGALISFLVALAYHRRVIS